MFGLVFLVVIGTSIWVAIDASHIGARKGLIKDLATMGPAGWFVCCLLIWIIGFPVYLAKRSEIKAAAASSNVSIPTPVNAGHVAQNSVASPPAVSADCPKPATLGRRHSIKCSPARRTSL